MALGNGMVPASQRLISDNKGGRYPSGIVATTFAEVGVELEFVSEELSRDVEVLAADHDDVLPVEDLFGDGRGKTTWRLALRRDSGTYLGGVLCRQ